MKSITKTLLTAAALLLASLTPTMAQTSEPLKTFLVIGHNNAAAWGRQVAEMAPNHLPEDMRDGVPGVFVWHDNSWQELDAELVKERHGPGIAMAATLKEEIGGPIGVIMLRKAFSKLSTEWNPEGGEMYQELSDEVAAAKAERDLKVMGVAWVNGQNDRRSPDLEAYEENQIEFVESLREDYYNPELRFVTILEVPAVANVIEEQKKARDIPGADYIDSVEVPQPDRWHYTPEGQTMLGQMLGEKMAELLNTDFGG